MFCFIVASGKLPIRLVVIFRWLFSSKAAEEALRKEAGLDSVSTDIKPVAEHEPDLSNVLSEYER